MIKEKKSKMPKNTLCKKEKEVQTISSLEVAEMMGVPHAEILKKLEGTIKADGSIKQVGIIPVLTQGNFPVSNYFIESTYIDSSGKKNKCYNCTKMGCDFLANKFTGEKGIIFTAKYVDKFDAMEKALKEQDNPYTGLSKELQAIFAIDHKQQEMDSRITKLENTMTIDYGQQEDIKALVAKKVISILGGSDAPAYKNGTVSKKAFSQLHRWLKRVFEVNSYKNIAVKDFERAKEIIPQWEPSEELRLMIKGANAQMRLGA